MANKTIFQLPEQTGKTNNDVLAIVDSGNTTTSKIKVSTLLSGASPITFATGTTSYKSINIPDAEIQGNNSIYIGNNLYTNDGIRSTGGNNVLIGNGDIRSGANNAIFGASDQQARINASPFGGAVVIQTGNIAASGFRGGGIFHGHDVDYQGGQYAIGLGGYFWDISGDGCFGACNASYTSVGGSNSVLISSQGSVSGNNSAKIAGGSGNVSGDGSGVFVGGNGRITSNGAGILAGTDITITGASTESVAIGGNGNTISASTQSGMVGGAGNGISGSTHSVIVGGAFAQITGTSTYSFIAGGQSNRIFGTTHASVIGGSSNRVQSTSTNSGVLLGNTNVISGSTNSAIIAGSGNTMNHNRSVILGGSGLTSTEAGEVLVPNLKISGQTSGNFHDNGSGSTQTIDWNEGNLQRINLTANTSITLTNLKPGGTYMLYMNNGGTHSISSVSATGYTFKYETNGLPTITHNSTDLFVFDVFGTDTCYVRYHADFA